MFSLEDDEDDSVALPVTSLKKDDEHEENSKEVSHRPDDPQKTRLLFYQTVGTCYRNQEHLKSYKVT